MKRSRKLQKHELTTYRALSNKSTYQQKRTAVAARRWPKHCLGPSGNVSLQWGAQLCLRRSEDVSAIVRRHGQKRRAANDTLVAISPTGEPTQANQSP